MEQVPDDALIQLNSRGINVPSRRLTVPRHPIPPFARGVPPHRGRFDATITLHDGRSFGVVRQGLALRRRSLYDRLRAIAEYDYTRRPDIVLILVPSVWERRLTEKFCERIYLRDCYVAVLQALGGGEVYCRRLHVVAVQCLLDHSFVQLSRILSTSILIEVGHIVARTET